MMLRALLKVQLAALLSGLTRRRRGGSGTGFKVLMVFLLVYLAGCFFFLFGTSFHTLCRPLAEAGLGWLYFALSGIIALALSFIGSVFTAQQQIFAARDNDLLLSMPIPPRLVLASRMALLMVMNIFWQSLVLLPAAVVWCMFYAPTLWQVVAYILTFVGLPFITLTVTSIFAWLLSLLMARLRNKNIVSTVFSIAFLVVYFSVFNKVNTYIDLLVTNGAAIAEKVRAAVYPAYAYGEAIASGGVMELIVFLLCCAIPFAIVWLILERAFLGIATTRRGAKKIRYRERAMKAGSPQWALFQKELRRFWSNSMYVMNAALGSIFMLVAAVALVIYRDAPAQLEQILPGAGTYLGPLAAAALCLLASTNVISAPSISLEGKNLWIAKSLPVSAGKVLMSKVWVHVAVTLLPMLPAWLAAAIVLKLSPAVAVLALVAPAAFVGFCALFGVVVNLHFPRFDWINEIVAVKQSMSTFICMFASMGVVIIPVVGFIFASRVMSGELYLLLVAVLFAALDFVQYRWLMTSGAKRFMEL